MKFLFINHTSFREEKALCNLNKTKKEVSGVGALNFRAQGSIFHSGLNLDGLNNLLYVTKLRNLYQTFLF